ncbi:DEDD exonuclease domain-containing protein [Tomitella cavernea]|uniref:DEDD exonuclease domain-containing protein n=1 Tax=Tomitella cavernea TaxID=1387982 RepID=A0ABP9CSI6_9ACTN
MTDPATTPRGAAGEQLRLDRLDAPLSATTFVVVDLETTGGRAGTDAVTEIGAVKVRGGELLGEFGTLVDPGRPIPPFITRLTGISDAMVTGAPAISAVLPAFLEFARGAVLVAHNAQFDVGFLKAAATATETAWPQFPVLCTVRLARRVLGRDEAPSAKLSALARFFDVSTQPTHRALDDARATVDVLHGLLGRAGSEGVHTFPDLLAHMSPVSRAQKTKRHLADPLPHSPGVYLFRGPSDEVLYVGTAVDLHRRVRTYFTGSEKRARMKEMVALAVRIDHVACAHGLEAEVRELRLIAAHEPPYNRASKQPSRSWWVDLSDEPFPRAVVRRRCGPDSLGPFRSRGAAAEAAEALAEACGIRTCTHRIPAAGVHGADCSTLGAVGGCPAVPLRPGGPGGDAAGHPGETREEYAARLEPVRALIRGLDDAPLESARLRIAELSASRLFESAARRRDGLHALVSALARSQRLRALAALDELVIARPDGSAGWQFAVVRSGRLAAAGCAPRGAAPMPVVDAVTAAAETVLPGPGPLRGATGGEVSIVARWIDRPGSRIVRSSSGLVTPIRGAARWADWAHLAREGRATANYAG